MARILPYIQQKIKMWGVDILRMENIKNLIEDDDVFDKEFFNVRSKDENEGFQKKNRINCLDLIVWLVCLPLLNVL